MMTMALERGLFDEKDLSSFKCLCFFRVETVISPDYSRSCFYDDLKFASTVNAMAMSRSVPLCHTIAWCYVDEIAPGTEMSRRFLDSGISFPVDVLVCSDEIAEKCGIASRARVVLRPESVPDVSALCEVIEAVSDGLR